MLPGKHFGSTVTVTIQLVGDADSNRADAVADDGGNTYTVVMRRDTDRNQETDGTADTVTAGATVSTQVVEVDASGKGTFTITADDPDPTDSNNPNGDSTGTDPDTNKIDRVRVSYTVTVATGGRAVATDNATVEGSSGTGTITFSDARGVPTAGTVEPMVSYLEAPSNGAASNVVTVTVVDQFGKPVRGHLVQAEFQPLDQPAR